jgi:methionyl-tRNA formyltransferase
LENKIKTRPQKHKKATFTRQIKKIHGQIFWYKPAQQIIQMWRAYQPWPGIYTFFKGKMLKIIDLEILKIKHSFVPGQVFLTPDKNLAVACSKNAIILKKVHLEGKNPVKGIDFFNGHREIIKQIL